MGSSFVIPVKDSGAIYEAMKKRVSKAPFRDKLQQNTSPMIVSRYEQRVVWEAILAEYKSLEQKVKQQKGHPKN
jgi:hypothetical protein